MKLFRYLIPLLFSIPAFGQYGRYQTCTLQNAQGQAISGAQVYFLTQPANVNALTPLATVYSNSTGAGGAVTNPVRTNGFGECMAYLTPGVYTVVYKSQFTGTQSYADQNIDIGGSSSACSDCVKTDPSGAQTIVQPPLTPLNVNNLNATTSNVNGVVNPSFYGVTSNGSATTTTGAINSSSSTLTLGSATSFSKNQGIFVGHAGAACGTVRGVACPTGPVPALSTFGSAGSTSYSYRAACVDGLGGVGIAGSTATIGTGNASLSATNYNVLTFTGVSGCIEAAIYRNGAYLINTYLPGSGTFAFNDVGASVAAANRDIPATPPAAALNDNLVAYITNLAGTTATLSVPAGATRAGAAVYHSDVPLVQQAIDTGKTVVGDTTYRMNYPLNLTQKTNRLTLSVLCDTNDMCADATGQQGLTLVNSSLNALGAVAPSSIGLYCARDSGGGTTSQNLNTSRLYINVLAGTFAPGSVAFYNYGCEIERHDAPDFNAQNANLLTSNNIYNVRSLFDSDALTGNQSMSDVTYVAPAGGVGGYGLGLDNAYTINIFGGYLNGGSTNYPVVIFPGQSGNIVIDDYRVENSPGGIYMYANATLQSSKIFLPVYRHNATVPQVFFADSATDNLVNVDLWIDDFGGSSTTAALTNGCGVTDSKIFVGVHETFDQFGCFLGNNTVLSTANNNILQGQTIFNGDQNQNILINKNTAGAIAVQQWFVPGATAPLTSSYGPGFIYGWTANGCGTGLPDFALLNASDGCVLRYQQNIHKLFVGAPAGPGIVSANTGYEINGAAPLNHCLIGDGTNYVDSASCGAGGGNTTSTSLTTNKLPKANGANSIIDSSISDNGTTVSSTEPIAAPSLIAGTPSAGALAAIPAGASGNACDETSTTGVPASGVDYIRCDSTTHKMLSSLNGAAEKAIPQTIASGTSALGTGAIASADCATVVTTTATGVVSTDAISWNPNGSIKAVTGYVPSTSGGLSISGYPGSGNVNWDVCNWTSGSITPGAVTLNWRVTR